MRFAMHLRWTISSPPKQLNAIEVSTVAAAAAAAVLTLSVMPIIAKNYAGGVIIIII